MANKIITNFFKSTSTWDEKFDSFGPVEVNTKQFFLLLGALISFVSLAFAGFIILGTILSVMLLALSLYSDPDITVEKKILKNIRFMTKGTSLQKSTLVRKSSIKPKKAKGKKGNAPPVHKITKTKVSDIEIEVANLDEFYEITSVLIHDNMVLKNTKATPKIGGKPLDDITSGITGEVSIYFIPREIGKKSFQIFVEGLDEPIIDTSINVIKR